MEDNHRHDRDDSDDRDEWPGEIRSGVNGEEIVALLRLSTMPPPAGAESGEDDFGPVVAGGVVARAAAEEGRNSVLFLPSPRRDRHVMAWIGVAAVVGLFLAGGYSFATLREGSLRARPQLPPEPLSFSQCAAVPIAEPVSSAAFWSAPTPAVQSPAFAAIAAAPAASAPAASRISGAAAERALPANGEVAAGGPADGSISGPIPENPYGADAVLSPAPIPAAAPLSAGGPRSAVDDLIDSALAKPIAVANGAGARTNDLPEPGAAALPEQPARDDVRRAMESLADQVRECGGSAGQRLVVEAVVKGATGRVARARAVDETYGGTSVGACAARAVRVAKLPRFAADEVVVRYPFAM